MAEESRRTQALPESTQFADSPFGLPDGWWPVAHSEEVRQHPGAFRLGLQNLALYRDLSGTVRAVADRCPHRRLPLSMGRLTEDGSIQCRYHGWSFDGATGRCTAIPNLSVDERIPNGIKVKAFSAAENVAELMGFGLRTNQLAPAVGLPTGEEPAAGTTMYDAVVLGGMVSVWTGSTPPSDSLTASSTNPPKSTTVTGTVEVRAPHAAVSEALLINPGSALALGPLIGAGDELYSPAVTNKPGLVSVQRERYAYNLPRVSSFGPISRRVIMSRITTNVDTGFTRVDVAGGRWSPSCEITIGLTPIDEYRTTLRWRAVLVGRSNRPHASAIQVVTAARRASGRASESTEQLADSKSRGADPGVQALRAARASVK